MADIVGYDPADYQWETAHEEAGDQIVFDTPGEDEYTGLYLGQEEITFTDPKGEEKTFTQLKFRDPEGLKVVNAGYELREAFKGIPENTMTRIRYMKDVRIQGQASPMKSFRVDTAKGAVKVTARADSQKG
jgi:hypothetical protein